MTTRSSAEDVAVDPRNTWEEARTRLLELAQPDRKVYFRGHSDERWDLISNLGRVTPDLVAAGQWEAGGQPTWQVAEELEKVLLEEFVRAYYRIAGAPHLPEDDLQRLAVARHHGLPTSLLDWTRSPYVAAFFAFDGCQTTVFEAGQEVAIWAFDLHASELLAYNMMRGLRGDERATPASVPTDLRPVLEQYHSIQHRGIHGIVISGNVEPRIIHQDAFFTRVRSANDNIEEFLHAEAEHSPGVPILTDIVVPGSEQATALRDLALMEITPVALMNDADAAAATAFNEVVRFKQP